MKKTLVALAVLSATSAFAQVTLTGTVRAAYQKTNSADFQANQTGFALTDATIKVDAVEDIGSMKASAGITLDQNSSAFPSGSNPVAAPFVNSDGATAIPAAPADSKVSTINVNANGSRSSTGSINRRNTYLQLATDVGVVRFDQTRSGDLLTRAWVAPSNLDQGIYDGSGIVTRAAVDVFTYALAFGKTTASIQYVEGGQDGVTEPTLTATVLNLGYADGPLAAGFAIKSSSGAATTIAGKEFARTINNEAFVTYDFGVARVGLGWDGAAAAASSALNDASALAFGIAVPVSSALTVGANYASRDIQNTSEFAANYALSKRTVFNASYGRQTAKEVGKRTADQFRISLAHNF